MIAMVPTKSTWRNNKGVGKNDPQHAPQLHVKINKEYYFFKQIMQKTKKIHLVFFPRKDQLALVVDQKTTYVESHSATAEPTEAAHSNQIPARVP